MENIKFEVEYAINHMMETNYPRIKFWKMDNLIPDLKSGIRAGDDAVVVGKTVINMEGPYPLKLGSKTGLIHTSCDVVAMGGRPKYALNAIQGNSEEDIKIGIDGLKKQSIGLNIPIIGGNTQTLEDLTPSISVVVIGELIGDRIIRDGNLKEGDVLIMLGHPVEGDIGERVFYAKNKYDTYLKILESGINIHSCKDASRGGWLCNLLEMMVKSKCGVEINSIPFPRSTRYLGTYIISLPEEEVNDVINIAVEMRCPLVQFGRVISNKVLKIGDKEYISENRLEELIKNFPYKR